ncbi:MAG: response regulator [Clostridia bacterium]|nr:response regulator [Clostridia bacterium]
MVRLMIADDEEYERTYLSRFIEEHYPDVISIVYTARDGAELVEKAAELRPDLILMDIRMPRMDGLEAAAQLKQMLPRTEIVIISAYGQFSYARRAIQLGVKDFLVKPYRSEELTDTLNGLLAGLDITTSVPKDEQDLLRFMENTSDDLVWDLAFERKSESSLERQLFARGIQSSTFKCLTFYHEGILRLGHTGRAIIRHFFEKPALRVCVNDLMCLLVIYLFSDEEITYSEMNTAIRKTKEYLTGLDSAPVYCGVSGVYTGLSDAGQAFREASAYIENYSNAGIREYYRHITEDVRSACDGEQRIRFFILNRNHAQLLECASQQSTLLRSYYGEGEGLSHVLRRLLFTLLRHLTAQMEISPDSGISEQLLRLCADESEDSETLLENGLRFLEQQAVQSQTPGNPQIVRKARAYLEEHYSEPLGLREVADALGVSSGYLSKCFKAQGGDSFTEYLTDVRIEAAKRLMRDTDSSISDISYAVGFSDPGYFSKCFRKRENLSPSDYATFFRNEKE